jgi:hypothetical protein
MLSRLRALVPAELFYAHALEVERQMELGRLHDR